MTELDASNQFPSVTAAAHAVQAAPPAVEQEASVAASGRASVAAPAAAPSPSSAAQAVVATDDFRALYDANFGYVWHSLRRLGAPDRDLEDLCHDVFVVFYRGRAAFDVTRPLRPWLFGIAFRVASDFRRRAQHRFELPGMEREMIDPAPGADEHVARAEDRELVRRALAVLDLDRRAVLVMHDIDGHTMPTIAEALGAPLNTCYSRLRLGREQFAAACKRLRRSDGK